MPRVTTPGVDSTTVEIKQNNQVIDTTSGIVPEIEVAKSISNAAEAKFMQDEIEVFFQEPGNENDHQFVEVNVNGDYRCFARGTTGKLRRYHLAVLANAKTSRVVQKQIVNPDGSRGHVETSVLSLNYPFQVLSDPAGAKGAAWLKSLIASPV